MTLAFVCVQLDTGLEIFSLISGQKACHYLGGDKEGSRGTRQTVTNGDKGEGVENRDFDGDIPFKWPPKLDQTIFTCIVSPLVI